MCSFMSIDRWLVSRQVLSLSYKLRSVAGLFFWQVDRTLTGQEMYAYCGLAFERVAGLQVELFMVLMHDPLALS